MKEFKEIPINNPKGKSVFFASDFHLGTPNFESSRTREDKIVQWLNSIEDKASCIILVGDIFDFWFEYKHTVPKGYIRLLGKLAQLSDKGIELILFTGNHDMWMFDYLEKELRVEIYREPVVFVINNKRLFTGHGDGLGPGDKKYKFLKNFFNSRLCQWMFARLHPNLGMGIAQFWSRKSRLSNENKDESYKGPETEWLWIYSKEIEEQQHHDFYVFGHRHVPLDLSVTNSSKYINLGEWVHHTTYGEFDGNEVHLKTYDNV